MSVPATASQARRPPAEAAPVPWAGRSEPRASDCAICYEAFQGPSSGQAPKLLGCCRHAVCLACLCKLACPNRAFSFVVCPFCRRATAVPEGGLRALGDDQALLRQMAPAQGVARLAVEPGEEPAGEEGRRGASRWAPSQSRGPDLRLDVPVVTVSGFVPEYARLLRSTMGMWGMLHLREVRTTTVLVVDLPSRVSSLDRATPKSVENLRLAFAVTLLLIIVSVFFALVFFK